MSHYATEVCKCPKFSASVPENIIILLNIWPSAICVLSVKASLLFSEVVAGWRSRDIHLHTHPIVLHSCGAGRRCRWTQFLSIGTPQMPHNALEWHVSVQMNVTRTRPLQNPVLSIWPFVIWHCSSAGIWFRSVLLQAMSAPEMPTSSRYCTFQKGQKHGLSGQFASIIQQNCRNLLLNCG